MWAISAMGGVLVGIRADYAGDDIAEVVGAPRDADLGQRVPYGGGDALLVKGHGRLRPQAGQEVQGAGRCSRQGWWYSR